MCEGVSGRIKAKFDTVVVDEYGPLRCCGVDLQPNQDGGHRKMEDTMAVKVPLQSTVRIDFESGSAAGQRRYRLMEALEIPPRLVFNGELPIEGAGNGVVTFALPDGDMLQARAKLFFDPERPERGSQADLVDLPAEQLQQLQSYVEQRQPQP